MLSLIDRLLMEASASEELNPGDSDIETMREAAARIKELEAERDRWKAGAKAMWDRDESILVAKVAVLREALDGLLTHPGIADMDPRDKDPEDHVLERAAREARDNPDARAEAIVEVVKAAIRWGTANNSADIFEEEAAAEDLLVKLEALDKLEETP